MGMRAKDLAPGDVIISRDEDNHIFELDMVQDIRPDQSVMTLYVQRWFPQEPERVTTRGGLLRYVGNEAILEVLSS